MSFTKKILAGIAFLAVFAGIVAVTMLLWNALVPQIIGWTAINYWQAAGLMILCRLLFGGLGRFGKRGHFFHGHGHDHRHIHQLRDRMKGMTRKERKEFLREHMRKNHPFFDEEMLDVNFSNGKQTETEEESL